MEPTETEYKKWDPCGAKMVVDNSDIHVIMLMNRNISREEILKRTQSPMFQLMITVNTRAAINKMMEVSK